MARPRKPEGEKLVAVTTCLSPRRYDELDRLAKASDMPLSRLLRKLLERGFQNFKTTSVAPSP